MVLRPRNLLSATQLVRLCSAASGGASEDIQLGMDVMVGTADGRRRVFKALIDTGAQTNCVRMGTFPQKYFKPAKVPIALSTVSCEPLQGGQPEVYVRLIFCPEGSGGKALKVDHWDVEADLYDSAIQVDLILGYP